MRLFSPKSQFQGRAAVAGRVPRRVFAGALVLAAALAACGGASSPAPAGSSGTPTAVPSGTAGSAATAGAPASGAPSTNGSSNTGGNPSDACSVVAKADVEAAFGGSSTDGTVDSSKVCTFEVSGTLKAGQPGESPLRLRVFFDVHYVTYATVKPMLGDAVVKVDGLGSEAYYTSQGNLLHVQVPGGMLTIGSNADLPDKAIQQQSTIDLAKTVIARL